MQITELAVKRPVTTIMVFLALIIMGFISLFRTPRELMPSLVYPQVTIVTAYENASPEEVERQITQLIEESIGTVNNLKRLNSISREGLSMVMAEFWWGTNMDMASMDVREKIDLVKERLPREAQEPIVMKFNPFEMPVITALLSRKSGASDPESLYKMKELAEKTIKDSLEKLEGVASVEIKGGRDKEILVEVDQSRLMAAGISLLEVLQILKNSNLSYPAGTIKSNFFEYLIRTEGKFETIEDVRNTPVKVQYFESRKQRMMAKDDALKEQAKGLILLSDIGKITDTFKEKKSILRHNGQECVSISVKRQSGGNIVKVAEKIRKKFLDIQDKIGEGYNLEIIYDQSEFIEESISGVGSSALMGSVLALFVLFVFLRNFRNSLIVTVAIPVSLMGTFILMYFQGISINMMSLGGLALGVGMMVDNSIVVLENIFRLNVERPGRTMQNCIDGGREVIGAITSSTLTTITVFLPFVFVAGVAGQLFKELAYTVTFSLITSFIVAITLIPRLASGVDIGIYKEPEWTEKLKKHYINFLEKYLNRRALYNAAIAVIFILSVVILLSISSEFMPQTKQKRFVMKVELPPGTSITKTDSVVAKIESIVRSMINRGSITTSIGSEQGDSSSAKKSFSLMRENEAEIIVMLEDAFAHEIIQPLKDRIDSQGFDADIEYITDAGVLGGAIGGSAPIAVEVKGNDVNTLIEISKEIEKRMQRVPFLYGVKNLFKGYQPEFSLKVNKDRSALYGISTKNVTLTAQTAIKGYVATQLKQRDDEIDIRVVLKKPEHLRFSGIETIFVRSPFGFDVMMNQLGTYSEEKTTSEIWRKDGERILTVTANYMGASFSNVVESIEKNLVDLRDKYRDFSIEVAGEKMQMNESFGSLVFVIILSLVFVYMIMASQFESLWQPFIIAFTVPLSIIGVALFLALTGTTLNVVALLGIIMLGGIVVNNGIVLVSYFNELQGGENIQLHEVVVKASATRLRPVLMTAMTTILGLIPMAISGGQGSELRAPLAVTVIGGLLVSTFLTLFIIPAFYLDGRKIIEKFSLKKISGFFEKIGW